MGQLSVHLASKVKELHRSLRREERTGVSFPRFFTSKLEPGVTPYDQITWELRTATIGNDKGSVIFEQRDVEVPADWSQTATNIVVSKYFHGRMGSPERESSVGQLVHRVVDTIADWGIAGNYFKTQRRRGEFPPRAGALDADAEGVLQFAGVVQRGRDGIARLRLLFRRSRAGN